MAIVPLPLPRTSQARALLHHLLEHGDIVGRDAAGRTIIQLSVDDRVLETLMTFDADAAELEPEPDDEEDGPPIVLDLVRPKVVERRRVIPFRLGRLSPMARRATIQLKVHRQLVQSIPLDDADIECLIQGLRLVTPCTQRIDRLIDLLEQIRGGGRGTRGDQGDLAPRAECDLTLRALLPRSLDQYLRASRGGASLTSAALAIPLRVPRLLHRTIARLSIGDLSALVPFRPPRRVVDTLAITRVATA